VLTCFYCALVSIKIKIGYLFTSLLWFSNFWCPWSAKRK